MSKRKFTVWGETPTSYQCTNKKCKWEGTDEEKDRQKTRRKAEYAVVCPDCGKDEFYGLI